MSQNLTVVLIENAFEKGWFCLPIRHRNLAKNLMKLMENGTKKDYQDYLDMTVNFAVGYGKSPHESYQNFHETYLKQLTMMNQYRCHLGLKVSIVLTENSLNQSI